MFNQSHTMSYFPRMACAPIKSCPLSGLIFIETSAKTGENVEETFLRTAKKIYENIQAGNLELNPQQSGVHFVKPGSTNIKSEPAGGGSKCKC